MAVRRPAASQVKVCVEPSVPVRFTSWSSASYSNFWVLPSGSVMAVRFPWPS
jgi:hypothetical protein